MTDKPDDRQELDDPMTRRSVENLAPASRRSVESFLKEKALPETLGADFLKTLSEALSGLERIVLHVEDVRKALEDGGMPCTPEDLRGRLERFLDQQVQGHDRSKVRLVLEN